MLPHKVGDHDMIEKHVTCLRSYCSCKEKKAYDLDDFENTRNVSISRDDEMGDSGGQ